MRFYEQLVSGRTIICADLIANPNSEGDRVMRDVDADCWIDAKQKLGYMLSGLQEWLLSEFYRKREEAMKRLASIGAGSGG